MTTPEENKEATMKEMIDVLDRNIANFNLAMKQHNPHLGNHIIHIKGQLIDIANKHVGCNPLKVPKYSRQYARKLASKIKDGNGNRGEQMQFNLFCEMALGNLERLKASIIERFKAE